MKRKGASGLPLWVALAIAVSSLMGCRTQRIVTVPEYHEVYVHQRDTVSTVDSIYVQDSVLVMQLHDTIYITRTREKFRDRWRDRLVTDTVIERDTVTVVRAVEKPPSRWEEMSMWIGRASMLLLLLYAVAYAICARLRL